MDTLVKQWSASHPGAQTLFIDCRLCVHCSKSDLTSCASGVEPSTFGDDPAFRFELAKQTHKMIIDIENQMKRAEEYKQANELRVQQEREQMIKQMRAREEQEEKWEEGREDRVNSWRQWQVKGGSAEKRKPEDMPPSAAPAPEKKAKTEQKKKFMPTGLRPPKLKLQH